MYLKIIVKILFVVTGFFRKPDWSKAGNEFWKVPSALCVKTNRYRYLVNTTFSMVQSPSWEANWFAASQEIPLISRNLKVHYRTHKRPPTVSIPGQHSPVHIPTSHFLEIHPNIIHPSSPRSPQWFLPSSFPIKILYTPLSSPIRATCPAHLILLYTYLFTPWCRVLLEKLTGLQLVKKFLAFHGTRWFITALTSIRHLSLSWASPIQSIYPHPTSWRFILILSTHLRLGLPSGLLPSWFPTKTLLTSDL